VTQVWFARVRSLTGPGSRMTPVSREGWLVVAGFIGAMVVGATVMGALMLSGAFALGIISFVVIAIIAVGAFIGLSVTHGDNARTAADYRSMGQGGST
jgi:hypothetical protein